MPRAQCPVPSHALPLGTGHWALGTLFLMDPEFTKILIRVMIVGGSIGVIGASVLFFAVRAYRKGEFRASVLVAALLAFVLVCCLVLLRFSFIR